MLRILCVMMLLVMCGCPAPNKPNSQKPGQSPAGHGGVQPGQGAGGQAGGSLGIGSIMGDETMFYDELKRLQSGASGAPIYGSLPPGGFDSRFTLSSEVETNRIGLKLIDGLSGEEWVLWVADTSDLDGVSIDLLKDNQTAGGYVLEYRLAGLELTVILTAQWINGRYLKLARETLLGGIDYQDQIPPGCTAWYLDGPWLPYRMVPGNSGPYGVVADDEFDGEWHGSAYPRECMAPAVATYDNYHGWIMTAADEHVLLADRRYEVSYRYDTGYLPSLQAGLSFETFNPTIDAFEQQHIATGLPVRDIVMLAPFDLTAHSVDPTLVEAQTMEVIRRLGELSRGLFFIPNPPRQFTGTNYADFHDWHEAGQTVQDTVDLLAGHYGCSLTGIRFSDGAVDASGQAGIGAAEFEAGAGLSQDDLDLLTAIPAADLSVFASIDYLALEPGNIYATEHPNWLARDNVGNPVIATGRYGELQMLDIRRPEVADMIVSKMKTGLETYPDIAGYCFEDCFYADVTGQFPSRGFYPVSSDAAASQLYLRSAEELRAQNPDVLLAAENGLRLCLPACANVYFNSGTPLPDGTGPKALTLENRLSNVVMYELFEVEPLLDFGGTLSGQLLATSMHAGGYRLNTGMARFAGFEAFAGNVDKLLRARGELNILYSVPEYSSYCINGERPAACEKLVAMLPADPKGAKAVWLAFHGTNGSVRLDQATNNLVVGWEGGAWSTVLPGGLWEINHPSPDNVIAGDVVMLNRQIITPTGAEDDEVI